MSNQPVTLYHVANWNECYENSRSRVIKDLSWVPVPNNHDGEAYARLMALPDAAEIFTAWILILQIASRCEPRGVLVRGNNKPHDPESLALRSRAPAAWFKKAIPHLLDFKWLQTNNTAPARHEGDGVLPKKEGTEGKEQKEGNEGREGAASPLSVGDFPESLRSPQFLNAWNEWLAYRRERKLPVWKARTIAANLAEMEAWGEPAAIQAIADSIRNGWQGVFPPKSGQSNNQTTRTDSRIAPWA